MISVVGMGPGHIDYVCPAAQNAVREADINIAFGRISDTARQICDDVIVVESVTQIENQVKLFPGKDIAILASGDPEFFGITTYLKNKSIQIDKVIPGLSSFQYMACKLNMNWHEAAFCSFHGRKFDLTPVIRSKFSIILTDKNTPPDLISENLRSEGAVGSIWVGSDLSYPNETIVRKDIGETFDIQSSLNIVFIKINSIEI